MAKLLRLRRGTTTQHGSFTGAEGEVTVDTDKDTLVVHDNSTAGGRPLLREDLNNMPASGVTAGTYGSASAIPAITVDAKGRVTSATTNAIDSTSIANGTSNVSVAASSDITVTRAGSTALTFTGNGPLIPDGQELRLGTGADLRIWHSGTDSFISDVGPGDLHIRSSSTFIADGNATSMLNCNAGGSVQAFHNGFEKLATTSSGINVTGSVTCDGLTVDGTALVQSTTGQLEIKDTNNTSPQSECLIRGKDSANANLWYYGTGNSNEDLYVWNYRNGSMQFSTNNTLRAQFTSTGHFVPGADATYDLGSTGAEWNNGYFTGTVFCDGLTCDGPATIAAGTGELILKDSDTSGSGTGITAVIRGAASDGAFRWWVGDTSASNSNLEVYNQQNGAIIFGTNNTDRCMVNASGHLQPSANNTYDLGTSAERWRNVYTNDLNLSNEGGTNDVDGTWGSWTIQEGEDDLFLLNRRNGKKYKFNLSEVN